MCCGGCGKTAATLPGQPAPLAGVMFTAAGITGPTAGPVVCPKSWLPLLVAFVAGWIVSDLFNG